MNIPVGEAGFSFSCHEQRNCFGSCCRRVELRLYPVDLIRLKNRLNIHSENLLQEHCYPAVTDNPYFPSLFLRMKDTGDKTCPFLVKAACSVYSDRPSTCRMYPLERAVARSRGSRGSRREHYFLVRHHYCQGHTDAPTISVDEWIRSQGLFSYNQENELWTDMDSFFALNPWKGEGAYGPRMQLAFMVCYNIDRFREYSDTHQLVRRAGLAGKARRRIASDDFALLHFGYEWLKNI